MKRKIKFRIGNLVICAALVILIWILGRGACFLFPLDFSQEYRKVPGAENILFERYNSKKYYKRCFWGLRRVENVQTGQPQKLQESDLAKYGLPICDAIYSPDKQYILYCEIEYDYRNTSLTDDEQCYYRVYEIATGEIYTIYQAYKEWYHLFWIDGT